jgi:hypothetical protein
MIKVLDATGYINLWKAPIIDTHVGWAGVSDLLHKKIEQK